VPNRLSLDEGPADVMVRLNVRIPRGLKREIAEALAERGKNLNDWVRDALRDSLVREQGLSPARPRKSGRRPRRG
jgi:metal-responsive CopG/Arc/MetJ family transcriptional regulator